MYLDSAYLPFIQVNRCSRRLILNRLFILIPELLNPTV